MKTGIIGVGSPFGNDNVGQTVIKILQQKLSSEVRNNKIQLSYYDRPGIYLLESMKNFDVVHLVDAVVSQNKAGTIYRYEDITTFQTNHSPLSSHGMGVAEVLSLGDSLNYLPSKIIIHGIEIDPNATDSSDILLTSRTLATQIAQEIFNDLRREKGGA